MRVTVSLLLTVLSAAAGQNVTAETHRSDEADPPHRHWSRDFIAPLVDVDQLRQKYLADPAVSREIKHAIEQRVVIAGMCPLEAAAAAGLPLHYMVQGRDEKPLTVPPPAAIAAQCEHPDETIAVELLFRNDRQFHSPEAVIFRVRFESGRAVFVDRERFGRPHQPDEET